MDSPAKDDLQEIVASAEVLAQRGKALLMERLGMRHPEAFRPMQKPAMNQPRTMRQASEAIILAAEVGEGNR